MKLHSICLLSLGSLLFTLAPAAHAAIGTLTCNTTADSTAFSANVTAYNLTVTPALPGGSGGVSGAGGGSLSTNPLVLRLPLSSFQQLSTLAANGTTLSSCVLTANDVQYVLNTLSFTSVQAIGKTPTTSPFGFLQPEESTAYTKLTLTYGGLRVLSH